MHRRTVSLSLPVFALGLGYRGVDAQPSPSSASDQPKLSATRFPAFDPLDQKIEAVYTDVKSVVVVRKGQVLFEHHKSKPDALHDVQSVTKSVLSLAVGAALGRGAIRSLDQSVREIVGLTERVEALSPLPQISIRHLLTMTAGFRTQERFARHIADDPEYLMRRDRVEAPGAVFAYDNLSTNLLAIAVETATGQSVSSFAEQAIFRPLGITAYSWEKGWNGHTLGHSGLQLRTRDMVRLGELALDNGVSGGTQLIPEDYIRSAVTAQNPGGMPVGLSYGYMWWVVPSATERRTFLASGWGGQFIWAHPPLDLVIATTSEVSAGANRRGQALALIRTELFRAAAATRL